MSFTLVLNAGTASPVNLVVQSAGENAPTEVGTVTPSFNQVDRSSVRGVKRNYGSLTTYVSTAVKDSIINLLKSGRQIACSGDLLANIQTQCTVRYTGATMIPSLVDFWTVGLTLSEVQPSVTLLRYSPGDTITGESFSRSTVGTYLDSIGAVRYAAINVKRANHFVPGKIGAFTLLEDARTNLIIRAEEFDHAAWTKSAGGAGSVPVVTANNGVAPDGFVIAEKVVFVAPGSGDQSVISQSPTVVNATQYSGTVWVKAFAAGDVGKVLVFRQVGSATYTLLTLTAAWQRLGNTETSISTTGLFEIGLRPDQGGSTGTVSIFIWGAQLEPGPFSSSYIPTTTVAVTRGADSYSLPAPPPGELTVYAKFVEGGSIAVGSVRVFEISDSVGLFPTCMIYNVGGFWTAYHNPSGAVVQTTNSNPAPIGDTTELSMHLFGDGSVDLTQSVNGAAATAAAQTGPSALVTAWSGPLCWLNSVGSAAVGFTALQSFKIVAGARSLAEMRAA